MPQDHSQVVWAEGMALDPHHLQQWDRHHRSALHARLRALSPHGWGLTALDVDEERLANGEFALLRCAGILPDAYAGPLRGPIEQLQRLATEKAALPLPAYVDHVLRDTHLLEIQLARGSTARAANLQIIVQRAADFAANEVDSLRPFVRWLSTQSRTDLAEAEQTRMKRRTHS